MYLSDVDMASELERENEQIITVDLEATNNELSIDNDKLDTQQCKINRWNEGNIYYCWM